MAACTDALRASVSNISGVLLNGLASAKTPKQREAAINAAHKGVELSKETNAIMVEIVGSVFR